MKLISTSALTKNDYDLLMFLKFEETVSKLNQDTGWQPTSTFEETLKDVLDDCRQRIQDET